MNSATKDCPFWSRGRFLAVVGVLFVLQAGLILLFGDRSRPLPPLSAPSVGFRALGASVSEDELLRQFFVGDPAVFPLPNPHGFSGRGWMGQRPLAYQTEIQIESPIWLGLDTARLGTNFPALPSGSQPILSGLVEQPSRHEEPLPVFLTPEIIPTQSVFRLEGGLGDRLLGAAPALRTWSSEKLLNSSEKLLNSSLVQIAVDSSGEVLATKLVASCGLAEADAEAVATARALRFRPSPSAGTRWGQAVFQWQTTEQAGAGPRK
jgi:TonB family protein